MNITERSKHPEDLKRLSRQIAVSANRLEKLLEIDAPLFIIERERRLLASRVSKFPATDISEVKE